MTVHEISPLFQAALAFVFLVVTLVRLPGFAQESHRWFLLFILGQLLWGLFVFGLRASPDLDWALRSERLAPFAVSLTTVAFYRFAKAMTKTAVPRWQHVLTLWLLAVSIVSVPTGFLVDSVRVAEYGTTAVWGGGLYFWIGPVYILMVISLVALYRGFRQAPTYTERNRLLLLVMAGTVAIAGGALDVAPAVGIYVPPATSWTNALFFVLVGGAILRYDLLDIQVTLRRRLAHFYRGVLSLAVLSVGVFPLMSINAPVWAMALTTFALVIITEPAWRKADASLRSSLERDLAQESPGLLNLALESIQTEGHTSQVAEAIVKAVHTIINPTHAALIQVRDGSAEVLLAEGYAEPVSVQLSHQHPLARWFHNHAQPVFHIDLVIEPEFQTMSAHEWSVLDRLQAAIYTPLIFRGSLEGVLLLGPKTGGSVYTWQEIEFLRRLGQQAAVLLQGIRLALAERQQKEEIEHIRDVQRHMVQARDEERRLLAAEIHDEPIQKLVSSIVRLNLMQSGSLELRPDVAQQQMAQAIVLVEQAEKSLRRIMKGVFPSLLHDLGLLAALEALCEELNASGIAPHPVSVNVRVQGVPAQWNPPLPVSLVIYRFVQEGLRNVLAHSNATHATATIAYGPDVVELEVLDNGEGMDSARAFARRQEGHAGLLGLEERVGAVGGTLSIEGRPEGGTRLLGTFPHGAPTLQQQAEWSTEYILRPLIEQHAEASAARPQPAS